LVTIKSSVPYEYLICIDVSGANILTSIRLAVDGNSMMGQLSKNETEYYEF